MRALLLVCVVSSLVGCMYSAGPVVGIGFRRGMFVGAEASAGVTFAHPTIAWQYNPRTVQLRLDGVIDQGALGSPHEGFLPGARLGLGHVVSGEGHGVFVFGPSPGYAFRSSQCGSRSRLGLIGVIGLELRYIAGEWELALSPRIDGRGEILLHDVTGDR